MKMLLAAAACALALGATACGDNDLSPPATAQTPAPLTGVHTQIAPSDALKAAGVQTGAIAPATSGSPGVVLPITGGTVDVATLAGTVEHDGGLKYTAKGKTVELTDILIDTSAKQVNATVGGSVTPVMDLQLGPVNQTGSAIEADATFTLTSEGAQALGIAGLQPGMTMGTGVIQAKAD